MAKALVKQLHADLAGPSKGGDGGKPKPKPKLSEGAKAGADRTQVSVKLSAQQVSQIERGRAVQLDLDAYRAAGGRARR